MKGSNPINDLTPENRDDMYALLLSLLAKEIGFKNKREKVGFYFIGLGETLGPLPTYPFK